MKKKHSKSCHCCHGSGSETSMIKTGRAMSGYRLRAKIGLRDMARRMGISHTFLWQMEQGQRLWSITNKDRFMKEVA